MHVPTTSSARRLEGLQACPAAPAVAADSRRRVLQPCLAARRNGSSRTLPLHPALPRKDNTSSMLRPPCLAASRGSRASSLRAAVQPPRNSSASIGTSNSSRRKLPASAAATGNTEPDLVLLRMLGLTTMPGSSSSNSSSEPSSSSSPGAAAGARDEGSSGLGGLRQGIINPNHPVYRAWRGLLIGAAAFTGIFVPWELGFGDIDNLYSLDNWATWVDLILVMLFMADIGVSHFVAYETDELLVDEPGAIATNYRRQRLALDVISAIPFDWIAYGVAAAVTTAAVTTVPESAAAAAAAASAAATTAAGAVVSATAAAADGMGLGGDAGAGLVGAATAAAAALSHSTAAGAGAGASSTVSSGAPNLAALPAVACLKGLHLVRLYRVRWFFRYMEYDLTVSLLTVTVARNLVIVLYLTHWVACGFNFLARSGGYDPDLLVGLNPDLFASISRPEQYLYSLYWSVTTLAGNEWNGMDTVHDMRQVVANTFRASVFLLFNIALGAYILGTITLLVVKNDERTGRYRDLSSNLKTYSTLNHLPPELKDEMQEHLRLKFNHQEASDDQVLSIYPTTIRRRILRHLYMRHLRASYLFRGTPRKFLDALLSASRLELFRPGVDLLAAGDAVNELFVVVSGKVALTSPLDPSVSQYDWGGDYIDSMTSLDPLASMMGELDLDVRSAPSMGGGLGVYVGPAKVLGPGELFGEISFFTEIPQMETVRSLSTVRVMVISRGAFESIERNFPIASRLVLENLRRRSESQVAVEFPGIGSNRAELQQLLASCPSSLMYSWASPELVELMMSDASPSQTDAPFSSSSSSSSFGSLTSGSSSSLDIELAGSSSSSSSSDSGPASYSTRPVSAAAAAAANSSSSWLSGSSSSKSGKGLSARQELVLSNLVRVMAVINQHMAKQEEDRTTDFLYAATRGDVVKLRSMLQQGFNPDSADYDGRTALMLACVRGHRDVVDLLMSAGADPKLDDNLGRSALLEACYHGHDAIIDTLTSAGVRLSVAANSSSSAASGSSGRFSTSGSAYSNISGSSSRMTSSSSSTNTDMAAAASYGSLSGGYYSDSNDYGSGSCGSGNASWSLQLASLLCNCVYECNLPLLRRLLRAGAPVNIGDYDKRTALHISAAEGNAVMLRVLVEEGGANVFVKDRWGYTPLDEARRVGATVVVKYLEATSLMVEQRQQQQRERQQQEAVSPLDSSLKEQQQQGAAGLAGSQEQQGAAVAGRLADQCSSSSSISSDGSVARKQLQQQQQEEAEAELKRQQVLQAMKVRQEVKNNRLNQRRVEAVGQLLLLAEQAQQALIVKADEIENGLAEANKARAASRDSSSANGSSGSSGAEQGVSAAAAGGGGGGVAAGEEGVMPAAARVGGDEAAAAAACDGVESSSSSSSGGRGSNGAGGGSGGSRSNNVVSATKLHTSSGTTAAHHKRRSV